MKTLLLIFALLNSSLYGISLDVLIENTLKNNPSLESINHRIEATKQIKEVADNFSNPTLKYTQNTINANEPMSQKSLTFSQQIPYFGKRDSNKEIYTSRVDFLSQNLEQAKVTLVKEIKIQAYKVWEYEKVYEIIEHYEDLTKQNIELFESYTTTFKNQHMGIMSAELTLSDLKIQKNALKAKIDTLYAKLSYLSNYKVDTLDVKLKIDTLDDINLSKKTLINNHDLKIKDTEIQENRALLKSAKLSNYPDFNIVVGYAYREKFDDYANIGIGITLPIYGTEDAKEQSARTLVLATQSEKQDIQIKLEAQLKTAYLEMKSAYDIYHIVQDEALPKLQHMFELTSSATATGGDLFKYIDILVQKLKLEQKSINAIANYKRAEATITALKGNI